METTAKKKRIPISVYEPTWRLLDHMRKNRSWDSYLLSLVKGEKQDSPLGEESRDSVPQNVNESPLAPATAETLMTAQIVNREELMVEAHDWRKTLEKTFVEEHAKWAEDWAECLAFLCQCSECKAFLIKKEVDIEMINGILLPEPLPAPVEIAAVPATPEAPADEYCNNGGMWVRHEVCERCMKTSLATWITCKKEKFRKKGLASVAAQS